MTEKKTRKNVVELRPPPKEPVDPDLVHMLLNGVCDDKLQNSKEVRKLRKTFSALIQAYEDTHEPLELEDLNVVLGIRVVEDEIQVHFALRVED